MEPQHKPTLPGLAARSICPTHRLVIASASVHASSAHPSGSNLPAARHAHPSSFRRVIRGSRSTAKTYPRQLRSAGAAQLCKSHEPLNYLATPVLRRWKVHDAPTTRGAPSPANSRRSNAHGHRARDTEPHACLVPELLFAETPWCGA
jgi:hypothetical protein